MHQDPSPFPEIRFKGTLRPSQAKVVKIAKEKLAAGRRRLHIVAPPGSGKTVLGLYLWAECIRKPALVLSPNSAIQAQWAARTDLFTMDQGGARAAARADTGAIATTANTSSRIPSNLTVALFIDFSL